MAQRKVVKRGTHRPTKRSNRTNVKRGSTQPKAKADQANQVRLQTVTPYLVVDDAAQALEFYKRALGAKEVDRQLAPDGKVMHAHVRIGDSNLLLSDEFPGSYSRAPTHVGSTTVSMHLTVRDVNKMWEKARNEGCNIVMPLEDQFWGQRYGVLSDPFGHCWALSQPIKLSTKEMEEKRRRAMEMMSAHEGNGGEPVLSAKP